MGSEILDKRGNREVTYSKSDFDSSTGILTLSIKGGGKVILEGMEVGDAVNVNGKGHTITGKKLV